MHFKKNLKMKNSDHKSPQNDTIQTPETLPSFLVCYRLQILSIGQQEKPAPKEGKFKREEFKLKKSMEYFFLKNTKEDTTKL